MSDTTTSTPRLLLGDATVGDDRTGAVGGDDEGISNDEIGHVRLFLYHHEIAVSTASRSARLPAP